MQIFSHLSGLPFALSNAFATLSSLMDVCIGAVLVERYISKRASSKESDLVKKEDPSDRFALIFAIKEERSEETDAMSEGNFQFNDLNGRDPRP